jgi:AraC-like DNA-binding protein/predicted transcriptional regulator YdeE
MLERVQTGIDYIEAHLAQDIALADVARRAGISQWHFQRMFKAMTGETLKTYIRSRRLAEALGALLTTKRRIIEIAMDAGFESQEAFHRAFVKAFGLTPNQYRQIGKKSLFLTKVEFDAAYLENLRAQPSLEPEVFEQPALTLVGLTTRFYGVDSEKNNVAHQLPPLWDAFLARLGEIPDVVPCTCYGVIRPSDDDAEMLSYCAGIAVTRVGDVPEGMQVVNVPGATYARFIHRGPVANLDHTVNYVYGTWLAQSGKQHTYGPDLEIYGSAFHPTSPDSIMEYMIPVRGG